MEIVLVTEVCLEVECNLEVVETAGAVVIF